MRLLEGAVTVADLDAFLAEVQAVAAANQVTVQVFDADYVVSREHLARAVALADRAFAREENVADDRAVEILLYAAGRRQIDRALAMGVAEGEQEAVVLVDSPEGDEDAETDAASDLRGLYDPHPTLGEYDAETVRGFFDIGDVELDAVEGSLADLVLERVALLDVEK
jgi:KEOPS complex subunit Cgi121